MGPCLVPSYEVYRPGAHGELDPVVVVRPARPGDVPAMAAIARTRGPQPPELDDRLVEWLADDERLVLVGERDETLIGWGIVNRQAGHRDAPDGWYIGWLVVHPAWRRRGVADRMVQHMLGWTAGRSDRLHSLVNARNQASLDLHARHGFREIARACELAGITFDGGAGLLLEARTEGR